MVTVSTSRLVDTLHHADATALPDGYESDVTAAETLVENQLEPHAKPRDAEAIEWTATFIAAAFIVGGETSKSGGDITRLSRESATVEYDLSSMSSEARDFWSRAEAMDPTGLLASARGSVFFRSYGGD